MQDIKFKEKLKKQNQKQLEVVLIKACIDNNVELVDYLLFSEDLSNNPKIEARNYQALRDSANKGSFEVIQYLLSHEKINKKELIEARKQVLIRNACHSGNLKLVKYLLETPRLRKI